MMLLLNPGREEPKPETSIGSYEIGWRTDRQWREKGFKPIVGAIGEVLWTNRYCQHTSTYYHESQVTPMSSKEIHEYREEKRERKNRKARERYRENVVIPRERARKKDAFLSKCWDLSLDMDKIDLDPDLTIVIDVETTGLDDLDDEILELAVVKDDGTVLFNRRFDVAWHRYWHEASLINHIWPDDIRGLQKIDDYIIELSKIIGAAGTIIGYNLPFDLGFLVNYGIVPNERVKKRDIMREFAQYYGEWADWLQDYKWQKLTVAAEYVGYKWDRPAHGALSDCYATLAVYSFLKKKNKNER